MTAVWIILAVVGFAALAGGIYAWRVRNRRRDLRNVRLAPGHWETMTRRVPMLAKFPEFLRPKLEGEMQVFLAEMSFEACGGLDEITEEMRLVIAAQAALLLVESGYRDYGRLRSVLVYPDAYRVRDEYGMEDIRLGESWETGSVVLSWQSVLQGSANPEDGLNVVLHEFAHQLDQLNSDADGLPVLKRPGDYGAWAEAFAASYEKLCARLEKGRRTVLDPYGAQNPAEFFAVATETFFEKPAQLKRDHAALYEQLRTFYGLDPGNW